MRLAYWMYAGPAHIGTLRVTSSFRNVHAIMHAPLGDDYFNVMRSMLERERDFTPVSTSIVSRQVLGQGSKDKVCNTITRKDQDDQPGLIVLTPTCTSSILQEDLHNFIERAKRETLCDVLLGDINHYRYNELQAADKTLEQIVKFVLEKNKGIKLNKTKIPSVNILGMFTLGFHSNHDCRELKRLLLDLGININLVLPEGCEYKDIPGVLNAWFNIVPYREHGLLLARYLESEYGMPYISTPPFGLLQTNLFIRKIQSLLKNYQIHDKKYSDKFNYEKYIELQTIFVSQSAWFARSIDCQNLLNKTAVVFGDSTHAVMLTKVLAKEMGIKVLCAGTYCKEDQDWFHEQVHGFCDEVLMTDNHNQVGLMIQRLEPSAIFGTQMERHIGKRLNIPCAVISSPIHIQNFTLGYRPFLGYEGANQIADLIYNCFTLGMEDHLLEIFGGHDTTKEKVLPIPSDKGEWTTEAFAELQKVPSFVRYRVRKNTEQYAVNNNISQITLDILYQVREKYSA
jgi:light-independent protochlorophyllide reductase subunit B